MSSGSQNDEKVLLAKESSNLIFKAIEQLPPQQKRVFQLSEQEGLSREDIANKLQISTSTVKNHLTTVTKSIDSAAITDINNIQLAAKIPAITPNQNYVFARIGVKIANVGAQLFSPIVKIDNQ